MASSGSYQTPEKPPSYDQTSKMPGTALPYQAQAQAQVNTVYAIQPGYVGTINNMIVFNQSNFLCI